MKGKTELYNPTYNRAGSNQVGIVETVNEVDVSKHKSVPVKSSPNSVTIVCRNGKVIQERYYGKDGNVYLDIDYTNHGNSATHPIVPHQHHWIKGKDGKLKRGPWEEIKND